MRNIVLMSIFLLQSFVHAGMWPTFAPSKDKLIESVAKTSETIFNTRSKTISVTLAITQLESTTESYEFITQMVMKLSPKFKLILNFQKFVNIKYPTLSNIFIVDSYAAFKRLYQQIRPQIFDYTSLFMVIVPLDFNIEIQQMFADLWELKIVNVVVLLRTSTNQFNSFTYYPYQANNCGDTRPVPTSKYFPEKYDNLNQCDVFVGTFDSPPFVIFDQRQQLSGIEGTILRELANDMNFSIAVEIPRDGVRWGQVKPDGQATGAIKDVTLILL
jgi:hypothetical protein